MRHRLLALLPAAALLLSACVAVVPAGDVPVARAGSTVPDTISVAPAGIGQLINAQRAAHGLPPLAQSALLNRSAARHAADMAANGLQSHTGSDGSTASQRISATGYCWRHAAENVAGGPWGLEGVFDVWMNSPGHRRNILSSSDTQFGFAQYGNIYVLDFARPC